MRGSQEPNILEETCGDHAHVEIGQAHRNETHPCIEHVASVQTAEPSPRSVTRGAKRRAGEAIELPSRQVTQREARNSVKSQQDDICQQVKCSHSDSKPVVVKENANRGPPH